MEKSMKIRCTLFGHDFIDTGERKSYLPRFPNIITAYYRCWRCGEEHNRIHLKAELDKPELSEEEWRAFRDGAQARGYP
jgi:hypothetical protein